MTAPKTTDATPEQHATERVHGTPKPSRPTAGPIGSLDVGLAR
ncbi:hypothetical protein ACH4UV_32425 [Streptomyces sp. NPDC020802]